MAAYFGPSLPKTASWLRSCATDIQAGRTQRLAQDYVRGYRRFRSEFCRNRPKMKLLFAEIHRILRIPKRARLKTLNKLMAITDQSASATRTIAQILPVFGPTVASIEQQFYGLCLIYQLTVEGPYRDTLKFFYAWLEKLVGRRAATKRIVTTSQAKRTLQPRVNPIIFEGYVDGHIRNSIAHGRFSFNNSTKLVRFIDVHPGTGKTSYYKKFTVSAFRKKAALLYSVPMLAKLIYDMDVLVPIYIVNSR